jgi:hypothetical protein
LPKLFWLKLSGKNSPEESLAETLQQKLEETIWQKLLGRNYLAETIWQKLSGRNYLEENIWRKLSGRNSGRDFLPTGVRSETIIFCI